MPEEEDKVPYTTSRFKGWATYEPDCFTLEEYRRLRAEGDSEPPRSRR